MICGKLVVLTRRTLPRRARLRQWAVAPDVIRS
jgi:hypothetical protein